MAVVEPDWVELEKDRWVPLEFEGGSYNVNLLELINPLEEMQRALAGVEAGDELSMRQVLRLLDVDQSSWRFSKVARFFESLQEAAELSLGESDGSEKSSGPTAKKSSSRASAKASA